MCYSIKLLYMYIQCTCKYANINHWGKSVPYYSNLKSDRVSGWKYI